MPHYVEKALLCFHHQPPTKPQHSPHQWNKPNYGAKQQFATDEDTTAPLDAPAIRQVQQITGMLLYYARAVDSTLLVTLGTIAAQQTHGTAKTTIAVNQLLDYCHTQPSATLRY